MNGWGAEFFRTIAVAPNPESVTRVFAGGMDESKVVAPDPLILLPNGIDALPDGRLHITEFFTGQILEWQAGSWRALARNHRGADAIVHDRSGRIYVTEVITGKVWRYAADRTGREDLGGGLSPAADMMVDEAAGCAVVPDTKRGLLVFLPLN